MRDGEFKHRIGYVSLHCNICCGKEPTETRHEVHTPFSTGLQTAICDCCGTWVRVDNMHELTYVNNS